MKDHIPKRSMRSGSVMALTVICLTAMLGIAALVIDIGLLYVAKQIAQNTADQCAVSALSGEDVFRLPPTYYFDTDKVTSEVQTVYDFIVKKYPKMNDGDDDARKLRPAMVTDNGQIRASGAQINITGLAVQVACVIPVDMSFARIFGLTRKDVEASAVAMLYFDPNLKYAFAPWAISSETMNGTGVPVTPFQVGQTLTLPLNNSLGLAADGTTPVMKRGFTAIALNGETTLQSYGDRLQGLSGAVALNSDLGHHGLPPDPPFHYDDIQILPSYAGLNDATYAALIARSSTDSLTYGSWKSDGAGGSYPDSKKILLVPVADTLSRRVNGFAPFFISDFSSTTGMVTCTLLSATWTGGVLRWGTKPKLRGDWLSTVSKISLYDSGTLLQ